MVIAKGVEGKPHHGGVDVYIVGDQLDLGTLLQRGDDGARLTVGDAGHRVVQVGHVGGTGGKGGLGRIIVSAGVRDGNAHLIVTFLDKIEVSRLLGRHIDQLDQPAAARLQAAEHGCVRPHDILGVLGADLAGADVGAFHIDAHQICAVLVPVRCGHIHDAVQDLLAEGHRGGADGQNALARLKIRDGLQACRIGIAEIMTDRAVEMDIHQTRQRVGTARVNDILALQRGCAKDDAAVTDDKVFLYKAAAVAVNFCIFDDHSSIPPLIRSRSGLPRHQPE